MLSVKRNGLYLITAVAQGVRCRWVLKSSVAPELIREVQSPSILISITRSQLRRVYNSNIGHAKHPCELPSTRLTFTTLIQCHYPVPLSDKALHEATRSVSCRSSSVRFSNPTAAGSASRLCRCR